MASNSFFFSFCATLFNLVRFCSQDWGGCCCTTLLSIVPFHFVVWPFPLCSSGGSPGARHAYLCALPAASTHLRGGAMTLSARPAMYPWLAD
jgi:hypothetical protein